MDLPYFKAFPTDWEITMRKAGIPPAKRGTVYRLIFFAWQEQGLNLTEDETYERRMRVLAQAFGMSYCRFKPYLAYYKSLSECQNGLWLPSFLLQQLQNAMRFQSKAGTESEQSQNNAGTKSEQSQNNIPGLNPLPAIPLKHEQEHEQEREDARAPDCESNHTAEEPGFETAENSAPASPVSAPGNVTPFPSPAIGPNDDFSSPVETLAPSWNIGERFVLKACGLWESPTVEGNWRLLQAIRTAGAFVAAKLDTVKRQGGTPDLWKEFWYEVLNRKTSPRPEWIAEQWEAYDRWLIQNHEPHRARLAQGVA